MISVEEAIAKVKAQSRVLSSEKISVHQSVGHVLAEDLVAPISLPTFRQSSMDGYAIHLTEKSVYELIGEVKAGDGHSFDLKPGQTVRIFTGAKVPDSANAVVIQERVTRHGDQISLETQPKVGDNIRKVGEQIHEGSVTLGKGHKINASTLGLIKSLGLTEVLVTQPLKATIVVTGNELVESGKTLNEGEIYESNGAVIESVLRQKGITQINQVTVKDNLADTQRKLEEALNSSDLILISGGISVGDYDFVGTALGNLGVEEIFYKVLQKPGKPLFFGKKGDSFVFALPGNPASTLTCFYVYVSLLIDHLSEAESAGLLRVRLPLAEGLKNPFGRALFLKAKIEKDHVSILDHQTSSTMISFAQANALAYVPANQKEIRANEPVETLILPYGS